MTTHDFLALIWRESLISSIAICIVLALRLPVRRWLGAQATYLLWTLVPCAVLAAMLPAPTHPLTAALQIAPAVIVTAPTLDLAAAPTLPVFDAQPWLLGTWLAGALALLIALVWQQKRYLRSLGVLVTAEDGALRAQGQGGSPALVGAWRPRIVLPYDFDTRFDARERELVLAHERIHLLRGDAQINALIALLRCFNWFNPLFHFAALRLRFDQELACDALVISRFPEARRPYADAMLKAQLVGEARQELRLPAGCYWPSTHPLKERIAMLKSPVLSARRRALASAAIAVLTLGAGYASWAAQPGTNAVSNGSPDTAAQGTNGKLQAELRLSVDGRPLDGTWTSETHNTRYMHHDGNSSSWTIQSLSGEKFSLTVRKDDERWDLSAIAMPLANGSIDFVAKLSHNGNVVGEPRLIARDSEPTAIEIGNEKTGVGERFKGIRLDVTLSRVSRPAQAEVPQDTPPSENIAYRKWYPPKYPAEAVKNGITGKVMLKVHVAENGAPTSAEVVSIEPATAAVLANVAIASAMQWRYNPGMKDGKPYAGDALIPIDFSLTDMDGKPMVAAAPSDVRSASYRKLHPPSYPSEAIAERVTGTLWVRAHVNAQGAVTSARIEDAYPSTARTLSDTAVSTVSAWTFNPATKAGKPIDSDVVVPLEFSIAGYTPAAIDEAPPVLAANLPKLEKIHVTGELECGKDCPAPLPSAPLPPKPNAKG